MRDGGDECKCPEYYSLFLFPFQFLMLGETKIFLWPTVALYVSEHKHLFVSFPILATMLRTTIIDVRTADVARERERENVSIACTFFSQVLFLALKEWTI